MFTPGEINIVCTDLERSLAFYRDLLGFAFVDEEDGAVRLRCGDRDFLLLPLAEERDDSPYCRRATFSMDLMTPDLPAAAAALKARGVLFERAYTDGARSIIIRDPDGLVIEVLQKR